MKKIILTTILALTVIGATAVGTFWTTMNNLNVQVCEGMEGSFVECFGRIWYHNVTVIE